MKKGCCCGAKKGISEIANDKRIEGSARLWGIFDAPNHNTLIRVSKVLTKRYLERGSEGCKPPVEFIHVKFWICKKEDDLLPPHFIKRIPHPLLMAVAMGNNDTDPGQGDMKPRSSNLE